VGASNGVSASVIASVTTFFHQDNFSDHFLLVFFFGASSASALHLAFTLKQCVFLSVLNVHILLSLCSTSISFLLFLGSQVTDDSCPYETFWCRKFLLLLGACCIWCLGSLFFWNKKKRHVVALWFLMMPFDYFDCAFVSSRNPFPFPCVPFTPWGAATAAGFGGCWSCHHGDLRTCFRHAHIRSSPSFLVLSFLSTSSWFVCLGVTSFYSTSILYSLAPFAAHIGIGKESRS
jgi:hypothetical protein